MSTDSLLSRGLNTLQALFDLIFSFQPLNLTGENSGSEGYLTAPRVTQRVRAHFFKKSLLNLLQYCFCFLFFDHQAGGILAPQPGIKPAPPALEGKFLTIGPPWKSYNPCLCDDKVYSPTIRLPPVFPL